MRLAPLPEIDASYLFIGADVARRAVGQQLAVMQNDDPIADPHNQFHLVFDQHHGAILGQFGNEAYHRHGLFWAHPRGRLVEQQQARLLLLDEPTAGMSPEETMTMIGLITKLAEDRTVVLVEHKMKLVMGISDRIIVLHHGELLADGAPDDIRANDEVRRVYLGQGG